MAEYDWTGLGLAAGTVLDGTNLNTAGNGTGTLLFAGLSGGATRVTVQTANGNGVRIVGPAGSLARLDTSAITGGAENLAIDFIYVAPSANPTVDHNYLAVGRNVNGTPASSSHIRHNTTTGVIEFCNASNAVVASGASPALVASHVYRIKMATIRNTLTTPTTSNGRIIGQVLGITNPAWNTTGEFFVDTGYTVNVTVDKTDRYRTAKAATACGILQFDFLNLRWKDSNTPQTSTTKSLALTNFVSDGGPTVATVGTGAGYPIVAVGTPIVAGAISYGITQTSGPTHTPVATSAPGVWTVTQDTSSACGYDVTVTETGGGATVVSYVVPAATSSATGGQFRRRKQVSGVLV